MTNYRLTSLVFPAASSTAFQQKKIRSQWDVQEDQWYFVIVDIIAALTESSNSQVYWQVLKKRLLAAEKESVSNCNALKIFNHPQKSDK